MKGIVFCILIIVSGRVFSQKADYIIESVPFTKVALSDNFWLPRIQTNRTVTIPASFERCENTGRVKNFVMAANHSGAFCTTYPFDDTDIYKTIEGASYSLNLFPDSKLSHYLDSLITIIGKAQEPDGYLYTARTIDPIHPHSWAGKTRWEKEREMSHELYNAGHLYEAAVAHYMATGKKSLLNIALKNADLVCSVFGPGKRHVAPGHEIVEMGLVKLYRLTGKQVYLQTAKDFIEARGHYKGYDSINSNEWKNGKYWQDDVPVENQREAEGHAVRAGYLYSAVADIAALTNDKKLLTAVDSIWENVVSKKMYVQGSVGAVGDGERFGENYELPNATAYNETCAAIANVYWNQRMFLLHGDAKYIDVLEKTLYNGLISGVGLDGKSFFYTNAMQITSEYVHPDMEAQRSGWFTCSCCPTNMARFLPSVSGYVYAQNANGLYVNLFINSTADIKVAGKNIRLEQKNNYPWHGKLQFIMHSKEKIDFPMLIRIPGWARGEAIPSDLYYFENKKETKDNISIAVNGQPIHYEMKNGYAVLNRKWKEGDTIEVNLPLEIQRVASNTKVSNNKNRVALQRGPIIYCAEWVDNAGKISDIVLPEATSFSTSYKSNILNGVEVIEAESPKIIIEKEGQTVSTKMQPFLAIPYYAWANRGRGEMMVWLPEVVKDIKIISSEQLQSYEKK